MGNCSCLERQRVGAWDGGWDLPAERSREAAPENGGLKVKIRMTKGQLRRLLESAGHGERTTDEDVAAEVMSMGAARVLVVAAGQREAAEMHHEPPKLETVREDFDL